jgi:hypothetical protein
MEARRCCGRDAILKDDRNIDADMVLCIGKESVYGGVKKATLAS